MKRARDGLVLAASEKLGSELSYCPRCFRYTNTLSRALRGVMTMILKYVEEDMQQTERDRADKAEKEMKSSLEFRRKAYESLEILTCARCHTVYKEYCGDGSRCGHCKNYDRCCTGLCESHNPEYACNKERMISLLLWCPTCDRPCCWRKSPTECAAAKKGDLVK